MAENKTYQDEIVQNYEQLRAQRDWTPELMGDHLEPIDPALAAEYRSRYVSAGKAREETEKKDDGAPEDQGPKARRAPAKKTAKAPAKPSTVATK